MSEVRVLRAAAAPLPEVKGFKSSSSPLSGRKGAQRAAAAAPLPEERGALKISSRGPSGGDRQKKWAFRASATPFAKVRVFKSSSKPL